MDDKDDEGNNARTTKYGAMSRRYEFLLTVPLNIVDEGSLMDRKICEIPMTILGDLRCSSPDG